MNRIYFITLIQLKIRQRRYSIHRRDFPILIKDFRDSRKLPVSLGFKYGFLRNGDFYSRHYLYLLQNNSPWTIDLLRFTRKDVIIASTIAKFIFLKKKYDCKSDTFFGSLKLSKRDFEKILIRCY